ncbi:MAG TPA: FAD-dependent oxidoreductase [Spirochaetia bacterium]|nr:FAD-dependent oxidoreductase [Spirochaetia bacterium]
MDEEPSSEKNPGKEQDYVRILSHQLKAPIHALQTLLNTIMEGYSGEIGGKTAQLIERARGRATQAEEMISDLLDFEFYSQREALKEEEFDILDLLNTLTFRYSSQAAEKDISILSAIPTEDRIRISGDKRGMEQALRNIIENAIKYTPSRGRISVGLVVSTENKTCELQVSDTGYGIRKEELEQVFEPFYRSIKHKANTSGTGLGLAIAKKIITNHKGKITVESEENKGTTFTVSLPYLRLTKNREVARERKRVVIVGGVTAGPKAAARLRRLDEDMDIIIIEKSQFLSYSGCGLPHYISGKVVSPRALMSTSDNTIRNVHFFESIKNITTLNNTMAEAIDREKKRIRVRDLKDGKVSTISYDELILATGALPSLPKIPGIGQKGVYTLYSLEDAEAIKGELNRRNAQDVFVIGGGLIGIGLAESLAMSGSRVTILERKPYILNSLMDRDMALKIQSELNRKGTKVLTNVHITGIERQKKHLTITTTDDTYRADLIILSTGVAPNAELAKAAGLDIGDSGGIKVNRYLQTSDENIYAVGDCAESVNLVTKKHEYWPLGSISTKMGRIVADNIAGSKTEFLGFIGTAMLRMFDINIARTGLTTDSARASGYEVDSMVVTGLDRAHYCDNAQYITLKVLADRKTKVLLGAQGYGKGDIVTKIEIFACAITQAMTLDDVFKLDLGYSPAFNNPIDITQTACLVLENKIGGLFKTSTYEELCSEANRVNIVDVSPLSEHTFSAIPNSINVPLENIRREDLPFNKNDRVVLYSKTSSGAYEAYMYLASRGYTNLAVLEGGYIYWES